jgi:Domain of unknown function (DUF4232)
MKAVRSKLRKRRLAVATLACGVLLISMGLAVPALGLGPATPRCSTSNLRLDKVGENDFTSHRGWIFALRNIGPATCHLNGFPRARLLDGSARTMPTSDVHFLGPARTVVLHAWHRAFFAITFAVSGPCPAAVFAYGMRITPPGAVSRLVWYAGRFDLCGPGPAVLSVSPVSSHRP